MGVCVCVTTGGRILDIKSKPRRLPGDVAIADSLLPILASELERGACGRGVRGLRGGLKVGTHHEVDEAVKVEHLGRVPLILEPAVERGRHAHLREPVVKSWEQWGGR